MPETAVATPTLEEKFQKLESAATTTAASPTAQEKPAEVQSPAEGQPEVVKTEGEPTTAETQPATEEELDLEQPSELSGNFEKFKDVLDSDVFKDKPELRTELKRIIGRESAFSEMGEFSTIREVLNRVPTVEDAQTLVEEAENTREFGRIFRESPQEFVSNLRESDPNAFRNLATNLPDILAKTDVSLWREQATSYLEPVLQNLHAIAAQSQDAALTEAVRLVAQNLGITGGRHASPASNPEVEELKRQLAEKNQAEGSKEFESFWGQTDSVVIERTVGEIEASLKKALPAATESQMRRMVNEAYAQTLETLGAQPQFVAQMNGYRDNATKGKRSISDHNAIVQFATSRAKLVIPRVAAKVASEWSDSILQTSKKVVEKKQAIVAKTKDVGAGPQATTSAAAATPKAGKRTAEDVFKEMETGTYVKR